MTWKSIRLELASTSDFPNGSVSRAYHICLPLDDYDRIDKKTFAANPSKATVMRHWATDADQRGLIVSSGSEWAMRCPGRQQRVFQLNGSPIRLGQKVSVVEPDGAVLPFKVASVR